MCKHNHVTRFVSKDSAFICLDCHTLFMIHPNDRSQFPPQFTVDEYFERLKFIDMWAKNAVKAGKAMAEAFNNSLIKIFKI